MWNRRYFNVVCPLGTELWTERNSTKRGYTDCPDLSFRILMVNADIAISNISTGHSTGSKEPKRFQVEAKTLISWRRSTG